LPKFPCLTFWVQLTSQPFQREEIKIAKKQGKFKSGKKRYHAGTTEKDKVIYDRVVQLIESVVSIMDIHREVGLARNTFYAIKRELNFASNDE
jgi:DNA invertase Pin-like site-specific DNA recombinase